MAECLHLACGCHRFERPLHGALARSKRKRKSRARPRFTVGEEGEHRRVLPITLPRAASARRRRVLGAASARNPFSSRARRPAFEALREAGRPPLATARDAIHRRAWRQMRARRACPSIHRPATLRRARVRARTTPDAWRARRPCVTGARHDGKRRRRMCSTRATLPRPRAGASRSSPVVSRRAAGVFNTRNALSTSAVNAGIRACRAASSARASAARAGFARRRRTAIPATTNSCAVLNAGGKDAGSSSASMRSASSMRPIRRRRRISRYRACAALSRSPCASSVARAASSAFADQPRSRETSATSASATMHLARATASFGPNARVARRRRAFARPKSPSCAIAMPRSARAGASSRRATRFNAPRGSPAASARAAAVISESIGNPVTLVTPTLRSPDLNLSHDQRRPDRRRTGENSNDDST